MFKFIFSLAVLMFGMSLNVMAQDRPVNPKDWSEDDIDGDKMFLKTTRLDCIKTGIKNATGETPDLGYLAAVALKARYDNEALGYPVGVKVSLSQGNGTHEENSDYRFSYLHYVARHISTYGSCSYEERMKDLKLDPRGVNDSKKAEEINRKRKELEDKEDEELVFIGEFIASNISTINVREDGNNVTKRLDDISKLVSGLNFKPFNESAFPTTIDDKNAKFNYGSNKKRNRLAKEGTDWMTEQYRTINSVPIFGPKKTSPLNDCLPQLKKFQDQEDYASKSRELCESMMNACGYKRAIYSCTDNPEVGTSAAPPAPRRQLDPPRRTDPGHQGGS